MARLSVKPCFTTWQDDSEGIYAVRMAVFVEEQGIPEELDFDGLDPECWHVLTCTSTSQPIGTARMQKDGHIGRIAVLKNWRRKGVGACMLASLVEKAVEQGLSGVYLHSQAQAVSFYEKRGFKKEGDIFLEADIPHQKMIRFLSK